MIVQYIARWYWLSTGRDRKERTMQSSTTHVPAVVTTVIHHRIPARRCRDCTGWEEPRPRKSPEPRHLLVRF